MEASTITTMAMVTAAIMTPRCSTMPTAVMMESSEKMASSTRIWVITTPKLA